MKPNQCKFCRSKCCSFRVYRTEPPLYDEVACSRHMKELHDDADKMLGKNNGILRTYACSSGYMSRGQS